VIVDRDMRDYFQDVRECVLRVGWLLRGRSITAAQVLKVLLNECPNKLP